MNYNQEQQLQQYKTYINEHSDYVVLSNGWGNTSNVLDKLDSLNELKSSNQNLDNKIKADKKTLAQIISKPTSEWSEEEKEKAIKLTKEIENNELTLKANTNEYNKNFQEAQQYLKLNVNSDGKIVGHFTDWNGFDLSATGRNDFPKGLENYGVRPKMQYMYNSETTVGTITNIIDKILEDEDTKISDDEWKKLYGENYNIKGDAYNLLTRNIFDGKFQYNIKRDVNDDLIDIRNINNFRASNIKSTARLDISNSNQNFINPTTADGSCASKSFYMSRNDFYWSENFNDLRDQNNIRQRQSIQNIILNEYQPTLQYNIGLELIAGADKLIGKGINQALVNLGKRTRMGQYLGNFAQMGMSLGAVALYNEQLQNLGENPHQLYNEENYQFPSNPMYYIEHLFNHGTWLNTYELPFIDNHQVKTDYLKNSTDPGTWHIGGLTDDLSEDGFSEHVLQHRISLSLPTSPTFNLNNPHNSTMGPLNISFYLINKDDNYLDKNFQFMQALFAGTQWLSMTLGTVVATNVYHVLVPGRFIIQWATLESEFQAIGKLRTNNNMYEKYGRENGSINRIGMIEKETLWPEAWSVKLTIKPLTPWNFNTHMAYYLNGFGAAQRTRLAEMKSAWWNTGIGLENQKNKIQEQQRKKAVILQRGRELIDKEMTALDTMEELKKKKNLTRDEFNQLLQAKQNYLDAVNEKDNLFNQAHQLDQEWLNYMKEIDENAVVEQSQTITNQLSNSWNQQKNLENRLAALAEGELNVMDETRNVTTMGTHVTTENTTINLNELNKDLVKEKTFEQLQEQSKRLPMLSIPDKVEPLDNEQKQLYEQTGYVGEVGYELGALVGGGVPEVNGDANTQMQIQTRWEQSVLNNSNLTNQQKEQLIYENQQQRADNLYNQRMSDLSDKLAKAESEEQRTQIQAKKTQITNDYLSSKTSLEEQHNYKMKHGGINAELPPTTNSTNPWEDFDYDANRQQAAQKAADNSPTQTNWTEDFDYDANRQQTTNPLNSNNSENQSIDINYKNINSKDLLINENINSDYKNINTMKPGDVVFDSTLSITEWKQAIENIPEHNRHLFDVWLKDSITDEELNKIKNGQATLKITYQGENKYSFKYQDENYKYENEDLNN